VRAKGKWVYLYRAVDSNGDTIDFLLSATRDAAGAARFLSKALGGENHPAPRVINTDKHNGYPPAIVNLRTRGVLSQKCHHRPVQYLNNILEQDHRAIKRRRRASQWFRSFWSARRTIAGYEAIHHDPQRPSGLEQSNGCLPSFHCQLVCRGRVSKTALYPHFVLNCKVATQPSWAWLA
jgi:transposase-like protein